jgi:cell division protein FtsW
MTYGLLPFATIVGVVCFFIVSQPDLSTAGLLALTCLTLFFVAGAELKQLLLGGGVAGVTFLSLMLSLPYARARVNDYLIGLRDPIEGSYQLRQVLIALGSGQWFGVGLGEGTQKFGPLPAAHTDGVFAILGEELGFVGCLAVIGIYAFFCWRGLRIALKARDNFGSLLALGVTCWLTYQALMNIAVITAVMPFTGIPLPFLSYGGSSLASSLTGVGLLLSISRDAALTRNVQTPRRNGKTAAESVRERFDMWRRDGRSHLSRSRRRK